VVSFVLEHSYHLSKIGKQYTTIQVNISLTSFVNDSLTSVVNNYFTNPVNIRQVSTAMKTKAPSIFNYDDYRDFLGDYYVFKKATADYWSYGLWIRKLGLKSVSALTMIVKKQRHMGPNMIPKFLEFFQFPEEEEQHFLEMIRLIKASKGDPKLLVLLKNRQSNGQQQKQKTKVIEKIGEGLDPHRQLVFQWGSYAVREMSGLKDFKADPDWISKRLNGKLDKRASESFLSRLKSEGLIDTSGKATSKVIRPEGDFSKNEPQKYHRELMQLSAGAVELPIELRALHASTLAINSKKLKEAKELIREFQVRFSSLVEAVPGDEVYQLNMQFFPLTTKK
jgi:uncharacterized protein (TIGR02147 family)